MRWLNKDPKMSTSMSKCKAIRVKAGHNYYRGFDILQVKYDPTEQRPIWIVKDQYGTEIGRDFTCKLCKAIIDKHIEENEN